MEWKEKVCVVTGSAHGIGRCLAVEFAKKGAYVAMIDWDREGGEETLRQVCQWSQGLFFHGDVSRQEDLEAFSNQVVQAYGSVHFLINNACITRKGLLSQCGYQDFETVLRIGVVAPYYLTLLFSPYFGPGAAVVNLSSTRAFMSQSDTESYSAAKGGISALTHAMAVSLAGRVRVNAIAPGWIDTGAYYDTDYVAEYVPGDEEQQLSGRVGNPLDIARAVFFLCSQENSFIDGEILTVDGGMTKRMIYHGEEGWQYTPAP